MDLFHPTALYKNYKNATIVFFVCLFSYPPFFLLASSFSPFLSFVSVILEHIGPFDAFSLK